MHDFKRLRVWSTSRKLGSEIYSMCAAVTRPEQKIIIAQLRRSALGIAANIAEGCGKSSRAETVRYLEMAAGSLAETQHHLTQAAELDILPARRCMLLEQRAGALRQMVRRLIQRLPLDDQRDEHARD